MKNLLAKQQVQVSARLNRATSVLRRRRGHFIFVILFFGLTIGVLLLPSRPAMAAATCQAQYTVQQGDTLAKIGLRYNISWAAIAQANSLNNPNRIFTGQSLCIPSTNPPPTNPPPATCQATHIVQRGDSLSGIGVRYGIIWTSIARANNLTNSNLIYVGQKLCIPSGSTQPPPTTPPPAETIPTFKIVSVVANQSVTITTANFPANRQFDVMMGAYGTKGINGTWVTSINSGAGGTFSATFTIPAGWHNADRLAIRLQNPSGYYSFNWFHNTTTR